MEKLTLIKVGGKIVEEPDTLHALLRDFAAIEGRKLLVHGGGRSATKLAEQLGIPSRMVNGRRITDADTLRVVTMVYGGLVNKNIVAGLQALGVDALGMSRFEYFAFGQTSGEGRRLRLRRRCERGPGRYVGPSDSRWSCSRTCSAYP